MELISKEVVKRIIDSGRTKEQMLEMVESAVADDSSTELSTEQIDSSTDSTTESSTGTFDDDCISRSEDIRIASGYCHWSRIPEELAKLPAVNPEKNRGMETG